MKKVLLLLADGFEIYEASAFIDVIGWNLVEGDGTTELFTCARKKEVISTFNQRFMVDFQIDEIETRHFDALAIPGGFEEYGFYNDAYNEQFSNLINAFSKQKKLIATICVGALPLGKSGGLLGKNATTYQNENRLTQLEEFGAIVVNKPIVKDDLVITSWNPSTAMDVAFLLLEHLTNKENTDHVKKLMGFLQH